MIQVKEMMQDNDLKNSKSKDKGSKSRSQSMDEQSHYKQDKTITRQSINVKRHIFNVIGGTEEFEERDLNIGGDYVAYAMDWKALKKMMTVKYCPRGKIKKLEIELWNLKVKGTDVASYTLRFQELALMRERMFHEESEEVEKYVGGLSDMIRGNVMSYQLKTMKKAIEFANDQMDQKVLTITERQAEQKRKLEFNAGNNQGHQQQNKRQNTRRAYTAGPGEKREYTGSFPLCTKCNYHHKGPCAPRCNKCKKIGHLARDYRSSGPNGNNNNRGNFGTTQNAVTCYECGVQGHFKKDCPKLKNGNRGNQRGNGNAPAKVYVVGNAGTNPDSNVVTGTFLLNDRYASILFDTGADRSFHDGEESLSCPKDDDLFDHTKGSSVIQCRLVIGLSSVSVTRRGYSEDGIRIGTRREHEGHLRQFRIAQVGECSLNSLQCGIFRFLRYNFLGHVIDSQGIHVDPAKIESIKDWASPKTSMKIHQFLGLAGYYQRFIEGFSKIAKPMTKLTQKKVTFEGSDKQEAAFQTLNNKSCSVPILALPQGAENFIVYYNVSHKGLVGVCSKDLEALHLMTIGLDLPKQILNAQTEAQKPENLKNKDVGGMIRKDIPKEKLEPRADGNLMLKRQELDSMLMDVKADHQRPTGFVSTTEITHRSGIISLWILSQSFISRRKDMTPFGSLQKALGTNLDMNTAYHLQTDRQSERTIQTLKDMLRACVIDFGNGWVRHLPLVEFSYNNSYHASIKAAPFEALYRRKCCSPIEQRMQAAREQQKSCTDLMHKPMEFQVGDRVMLKIGTITYKIELPQELSRVHNTFQLRFVEEHVEIMDREVKRLKQIRIPIVKVRWNSRRGPEFTWERKD
ncbi:putative reverse transcriptase domain-containing protein [Tanacetum coccineum]